MYKTIILDVEENAEQQLSDLIAELVKEDKVRVLAVDPVVVEWTTGEEMDRWFTEYEQRMKDKLVDEIEDTEE